jgi:GNAT superfamily N-acetyltransferase
MWLALLIAAALDSSRKPRTHTLSARLGLWAPVVDWSEDRRDVAVVHPNGTLQAARIWTPPSSTPDEATGAWLARMLAGRPMFVMQGAEVAEGVQGTGLGRELYLTLIRAVSAEGGVLVSNNAFGSELTSNAAGCTWASLEGEPGIQVHGYQPEGEDDEGAWGEAIWVAWSAQAGPPPLSEMEMERVRAVGRVMKRIAASNEAYAWLNADPTVSEGTFMAGACWPVARAMQRVLGPTARLMGIADENGELGHVVVESGGLLLDAEGAHGVGYPTEWARAERVWGARLVPFSAEEAKRRGLGRGKALEEHLVGALIAALRKSGVVPTRGAAAPPPRFSDDDRLQILYVAKQQGIQGFSGTCGATALAMRDILFGPRATIIAAVNRHQWEVCARAVGHVGVLSGRTIWDADGTFDGVEGREEFLSWGMLDPQDEDYDWPEDPVEAEAAAADAVLLTGAEAEDVAASMTCPGRPPDAILWKAVALYKAQKKQDGFEGR